MWFNGGDWTYLHDPSDRVEAVRQLCWAVNERQTAIGKTLTTWWVPSTTSGWGFDYKSSITAADIDGVLIPKFFSQNLPRLRNACGTMSYGTSSIGIVSVLSNSTEYVTAQPAATSWIPGEEWVFGWWTLPDMTPFIQVRGALDALKYGQHAIYKPELNQYIWDRAQYKRTTRPLGSETEAEWAANVWATASVSTPDTDLPDGVDLYYNPHTYVNVKGGSGGDYCDFGGRLEIDFPILTRVNASAVTSGRVHFAGVYKNMNSFANLNAITLIVNGNNHLLSWTDTPVDYEPVYETHEMSSAMIGDFLFDGDDVIKVSPEVTTTDWFTSGGVFFVYATEEVGLGPHATRPNFHFVTDLSGTFTYA